MGGYFGEGRPMRKPAGRWEYAIWSDNHRFAPDTDMEDNSKEERKEEGGENFGGRRSGRPWAQNKCKRQRS